ncbi:L-type lectin-domain containing receptor kinase IX.1-like [Triticum aestivum]|uniref:L-type lectin-domain containing receptor kinase IX.1-like n=1 Tax=Triticum aestivum TaxID=4565 RepID=UPI001D03095F|nr:L-type lectin-domain containing receptor kinase IX.1-like [Triticum aestivum]
MSAVSFPHGIQIFMLLYYSICSLHLPHATSLSFSFNFSQPGGYDAQNFSFQGDAYYDSQSQTIELTKAGGSPNIQNSVGRALYAQPVPLWDAITGELARFTTSFTFEIKVNSELSGDGMTFFLGHYPPTSIPDPLDNGRNLGLFNKSVGTVATGDNRVVAVEFDTFLNVESDNSDSHMGIDVNSIISRAYTNVAVPGKNLTSNLPMTCHISYSNDTKILAAVLQIVDVTYRVNTSVDLRQMLPSVVAIGFSGATGVAVEQHQIMSWSFNSTLDPSPPRRNPKIPWKLLVEATGPVTIFLAIVCIFVGVRRRQLCTRKKHYRALARGLEHFDYHKLAHATNKFSQENKLGQGGSASVYQGQLTNRHVAIKRFRPVASGEGRKAFEDELRIASGLRHKHLVELIGWCYDRKRNPIEFICWWWDDKYTRLFLVYELLPQGSLDQHLHRGKSWLPWSKRYEIILDLGSALQYLHVDCEQGQQCIVHGDIKSSNVLLGSSYGAKLGDFGLARFVHHETGSQTTDVLQGTYGYIDPVFLDTCQRNRQSDIYSFGIVLLEMVSGRDPTMCLHDRPPLSSWVRSSYHRNDILDAADERLISGESNVARQQMEHMLLIGLLCVHQDPSIRPSITHTMEALRSEELTLDIVPLAPVTLSLP